LILINKYIEMHGQQNIKIFYSPAHSIFEFYTPCVIYM